MRALKLVGRVAYDLVVGDDWKVAAAVVISLVAGALLVTKSAATWVPPVVGGVLGAAFTVAIAIDVRRYRRRLRTPKAAADSALTEGAR